MKIDVREFGPDFPLRYTISNNTVKDWPKVEKGWWNPIALHTIDGQANVLFVEGRSATGDKLENSTCYVIRIGD